MKKILFLLCLLLGHIASAFAGEYILDRSTLQTFATGLTKFTNGLSIIGGGKTLGQHSDTNFLQFSDGVQYTVQVLNGETVTKIVFEGFPHTDGSLCYLAEFNGTTYDSSTANFSDGTSTAANSYTFDGLAITSGSFTFTVRQAQTCMRIVVTTTKGKILKFGKSEYSFGLTDLTANGHMPNSVNTSGSALVYSSSNPSVASRLGNGKSISKSPEKGTIHFNDVSPSISVDNEKDGFSQQPQEATNNMSWEIVSKSNTITSASIDKNGKLTGIKGHGIIEVKATTTDGKSAEYVLTVADRATDGYDLVWDFNTAGNLPSNFGTAGGNANTGAGNTDITGWTTKYEGVTYYSNGKPKSYNRFIYTCDKPIDGDNALYIPATTGLQFTCNSNTFGLNNSKSNDLDRHVSFKGDNNVLTVPQLKKGDYVTIWWNPYSSNAGSNFRVTNATDLNGRSIDNAFSSTGIRKPVSGQVTFRAKNDGDMKFSIQDNGWNNIYKIRVSRKYSTDLQLSDEKESATGGITVANNNFSILVGQTAIYKGDAGHTHSQAARTPVYTVTKVGNFKDGDIVVTPTNWTSKGATYTDLYIKVNGGTGNLLVTQDIVYGDDKYVLDCSQTWLAVGQVKQQTYPYTWDFTSYNMDKPATKTVDQLAKTTAGNYGYWDNKALNVITTDTPSLTNLAGYTIDKPLFANGSQLTYGTTTIPETEGLGVSLGNYNNDSNGKIGLDGNALSFSSTSATFTIPNVDAGMYVFVKADKKPTVANATEATPESVVLPTSGVYCYNVTTKGDVVLTFPSTTKIEKIGVTNIFKTISDKATSESRDRAIDYSQTGEFTSMGMKAYIATQYADGTGDMGKLTLQQVTAVPTETGLLLYKDLGSGQTINTQKSFPLFVPAVNITPSSDQGMLKPHVVSGTVQGSDANTLRYVFTNKYYHRSTSEQQTGDFLFYRVEQSGNLGANKAYLELPHSSASKQFVVMSFEDAPATGIETPHMSNVSFDDAYYTIQGVKVNGRPSHPGIYIKNGKKVIVK